MLKRAVKLHCLIIGAGAAGLSAATRLKEAGLNVVLLEARNRIGGRAWSVSSPSGPVELGAEFVHGEARETKRLAKLFGIDLVKFEFEYFEKKARSWNLISMEDKLSRIFSKAKNYEDQSVSDYFQLLRHQNSSLKDDDFLFAERFVRGYLLADPARIGLHFAAGDGGGLPSENYLIKQGYSELLERMAQKLDGQIQLNTYVTGIEKSTNQLLAKFTKRNREEALAADSVIVTAALPTLLDDEPSLPEESQIKSDLKKIFEMGKVLRISFRFSSEAISSVLPKQQIELSDNKMIFVYPDSGELEIFWMRKLKKEILLTGWAGYPVAAALTKMSAQSISNKILHEISNYLELEFENLKSSLQETYFYDWNHDPLSHGAYSYLRPRSESSLEEIMENQQGPIYFAGEAFSEFGSQGTVEGALQSGRSVAEQILKKI